MKIFAIFEVFQPLVSVSLLFDLLIGYCIFVHCSGIGFNTLTSRILAFFEKIAFFSNFLTFVVIFQLFPAPKATKPHLGFDFSFLKKRYWSLNGFQLLIITNFSSFFIILAISFEFLFDFFLSNFRFL